MGSGNSNIGFEAHQFRQHLRAPNHRQANFTGLIKFGIARLDRCRHHNNLSLAKIFRLLPQMDQSPHRLQAAGNFGSFEIRSLHHIPLIQKNFGDTRHTNSTNSNKVNSANVTR